MINEREVANIFISRHKIFIDIINITFIKTKRMIINKVFVLQYIPKTIPLKTTFSHIIHGSSIKLSNTRKIQHKRSILFIEDIR